jgi:hypothetical protein
VTSIRLLEAAAGLVRDRIDSNQSDFTVHVAQATMRLTISAASRRSFSRSQAKHFLAAASVQNAFVSAWHAVCDGSYEMGFLPAIHHSNT